MTLSHLLAQLHATRGLNKTAELLTKRERRVRLVDLPLSSRPAVIAALVAQAKRPVVIITSREDRAEQVADAVAEFLFEPIRVDRWPGPEALPYEQLPFDLEVSTRRVGILASLLGESPGAPPVVVASAHGLAHLVMDQSDLREHTKVLRTGDRLNVDALINWAVLQGYQPAPLVQEPGTVARRGGIIDLFPPTAEHPIRIDLFGDEIESIRSFSPSSQRTERKMETVTLLPPSELPLWRLSQVADAIAAIDASSLREEVATEWDRITSQMARGQTPVSVDLFAPYLVRGSPSLLDYVAENALLILDEPSAIRRAGIQLNEQARELLEGFVTNGELPAGLMQPFASWDQIEARIAHRQQIEIGLAEEQLNGNAISLAEIADAPLYAGRMSALVDDVHERLTTGWRVVVATDQVQRLTELFEEKDIFPRKEKRRGNEPPTPLPEGTLEVRASDLNGGWMIPRSKSLVLSDLEIFGFRKQIRRGGRRSVAENLAFAGSLTPDEYVVHVDHGIARFTGLVRVDTSGVEREYLLLEYAKGDKLYVPVDQSDRVSRYGSGGVDPEVTRLGSGEWVRVKQRVRRAVREMAFELVQLYAIREAGQGHAFPEDSTWDSELAESFPYTETPDQHLAIVDVKSDMQTPRPMDRLVCGDVGFGKTEVALRAAFKAVNDGRQVVVLVPTTVLALQHFATFSQRLAPFPIRIEMLSRLRNKQDQRKVVAGLRDGSVDIVIGTHRLLQNDIRFKELGLVIIDEEQRFGVRHKEFLKQLRTEVDVLTMSATPIPRTLHMSLAGVRDISIINTAPQARLPIRTFVTEFSDHLVREVILREIDRGGQIYFVHNRVHSIDRIAHKLRELVPEARFGVGHGQMAEDVMEEVVLAFMRHEYDVLVSTTIIESGVDIPNVNSIIIDNADTFGLTQLYQLRGRVGRSTNRAYAYLLYRPGKVLSAEAQERLEAIQEATELGAGLRVAMRDMEIRGAGNILGAEQSGHIAAIGYDLYIRLLSQAVEEIRQGRPMAEPGAITLDLPITALIPAGYIADVELRLATYRQIAAIETNQRLFELRAELEDRFGPMPDEVEHLFALISVRLRCAELGIDSVVEREREIVIRPVDTRNLDTRRLTRELGQAIRVTPNSLRIRLTELTVPWQAALDAVLDVVESADLALERAAG
ncbi:MAG: transcription-repair coupling factor [Thermomicrobiales bacterium]